MAMPFEDPSVSHGGKAMDVNQLMNNVALGDVNPVTGGSWLASSDKIDKVKVLKDICLGNCRLLYGSERFKFYDIVICEDESNKSFCSVLICNQENMTKLLRTEFSHCPVEATRTLVDRLQKDTAILFTKYTVGSQIRGQQGYTNPESGKFELADFRYDNRIAGPNDDTAGLVSRYTGAPGGVPQGPRSDRNGRYGHYEEERDRKRVRSERPERPEQPERSERPERPMPTHEEGELIDLDYGS